jgi:hypothetical protein
MNGSKFDIPIIVRDAGAEWQTCWEHVLCLPGGDLPDGALFAAAAQLVRSCHARAGDQGIAWFREELDDGQLFVAEQLAVDPDDPDWQRVSAVLEGASSSLADSRRASDGIGERSRKMPLRALRRAKGPFSAS